VTKTRSRKAARQRQLERARAETRRAEQRRRHRRAATAAAIAVTGLIGIAVVASQTLDTGSRTGAAASATANTTTPTAPPSTATPTTATATPSRAVAKPSRRPIPKPGRAASSSTTTPPARPRTRPKSPVDLTSAQVEAAFPKGVLANHPAPAHSSNCNNHPHPTTPTTTLPATGTRVSIIPAPPHAGFPNLNGSSPRYSHFSAPPPFCINTNTTYRATIHTDIGAFTITLLPKAAPLAVNNFLYLAGYHYYNGTIFQRVIPGYLDQGGDPLGTGYGGPGYTFRSELPHNSGAYLAGTVGMANSGPNTNGSQFFIATTNLKGHIPNRYTTFAAVTKGMTIVNTINRDATRNGKPTKTHHITTITISITHAR